MSDHWVITFESVHYVMKAEIILKTNGFSIALIPTPREITPDCGTALAVFEEKLDMIQELLKKNNLVPEGYYRKEKEKIKEEKRWKKI